MFRHISWLGSLAVVALIVGCSSQSPTQTATTDSRQPTAAGKEYLLPAKPEGAEEVMAVREQAADEEEVLVVGRIGGSEKPWVDGRAAFSVVDRSLTACSDIPGDTCSTPWDYCCQTDKLPAATALVKVVDADGQLISTDARELLGLQELQTVVVKGTAHRDDAGNLTILASGIYAHADGDHHHAHEGSEQHEHHDHDHGEHSDTDEDHGHDQPTSAPPSEH